jgi:Uma2 family endonuclease
MNINARVSSPSFPLPRGHEHRFDSKRRLALYAHHGIPEYWIVDVTVPVLHVFHTPQGERYLHSSSRPRPEVLALSTLPEAKVDLQNLFDDLLPEPHT